MRAVRKADADGVKRTQLGHFIIEQDRYSNKVVVVRTYSGAIAISHSGSGLKIAPYQGLGSDMKILNVTQTHRLQDIIKKSTIFDAGNSGNHLVGSPPPSPKKEDPNLDLQQIIAIESAKLKGV